MSIVPIGVGDVVAPYGVTPVNTSWKHLLASEIASETGQTALKTSITDTGSEIVFVGSASSAGTPTVQTCYIALWNIINPDTGADVDWADGEFMGVEVHYKFGTNNPTDANKQACYVGAYGPSNTVMSSGIYKKSGTTYLASAEYSSSDANSITYNAANSFYGRQVIFPTSSATDVLFDYGDAFQLDDASTPVRVAGCLNESATTVAGATLNIMMAIAGSCDVEAYYRLIRVPNDPSVSLVG